MLNLKFYITATRPSSRSLPNGNTDFNHESNNSIPYVPTENEVHYIDHKPTTSAVGFPGIEHRYQPSITQAKQCQISDGDLTAGFISMY